MTSRRKRPKLTTHEEDGRHFEKTENGEHEDEINDHKKIPRDEQSNVIDLNSDDVVALVSEEESSEDDEDDVKTTELDPIDDDPGYNADAEDGHAKALEIDNEEEGDDEKDTEEQGDAFRGPQEDIDNEMGDDEIAEEEDDSIEGQEIALADGDKSDEIARDISNPGSGDESKSPDDLCTDGEEAPAEVENREGISRTGASTAEEEGNPNEEENSDDDQRTRDEELDLTYIQSDREGTDEDEVGIEENDGVQPVADVVSDAVVEVGSPDDHARYTVEPAATNGETGGLNHQSDENEQVSDSEASIGDADIASPMSGDSREMQDMQPELASEGEENSEDGDAPEPIEAVDTGDDGDHGEIEAENNGLEQTGDEPTEEAEDHSELDEEASEGDNANIDEASINPVVDSNDVDRAAERASESEGEDNPIENAEEEEEEEKEEQEEEQEQEQEGFEDEEDEEEDNEEEEGEEEENEEEENKEEENKEGENEEGENEEEENEEGIQQDIDEVEVASTFARETGAGNGSKSGAPTSKKSATEGAENVETVEKEVSNEEDDDSEDYDENQDVREELDELREGADEVVDDEDEDMEDSGDDDINTLECKLVPLAGAASPSSGLDKKEISKESDTGNEARDNKSEMKKTAKRDEKTGSRIRKAGSKSGVIYLPRIPPGLDVTALRSLLSRVSQTKRIWLRAETKEQRRRRQSLGGSRRKERYRDGWVELKSSKEAKRIVSLLNGTPMTGGKRKGQWADDLWCLRYLKGFEWDDLTREVFGGRERVLRVRESVTQGRQEKAWIEGRRKGGDERVRRFAQKRALEDEDEVKARIATERVEIGEGNGGMVNEELVGMLFKRRKT